MSDFQTDLQALINRHSCENASDTPDFILAKYLNACLIAWDEAVVSREKWYGRSEPPSNAKPNQVPA
jgi:hypothetical protein